MASLNWRRLENKDRDKCVNINSEKTILCGYAVAVKAMKPVFSVMTAFKIQSMRDMKCISITLKLVGVVIAVMAVLGSLMDSAPNTDIRIPIPYQQCLLMLGCTESV